MLEVKEVTRQKEGRMRIAAGIMLIVFGALSGIVPARIADMGFWVTYSTFDSSGHLIGLIIWHLRNFLMAIQLDQGIQTIIVGILLVVLISGGGIYALKKRYYWWAFSGAICLLCTGIIAGALCTYYFVGFHFHEHAAPYLGISIGVLCLLPGLLALIFLVKSKGQFHKRAQVGDK
jgi:hypothetical protein